MQLDGDPELPPSLGIPFAVSQEDLAMMIIAGLMYTVIAATFLEEM